MVPQPRVRTQPAHYVVRSSDGDVTQMVREKDEAWHSGNGDVNDRSIGIEHEAWTNVCSWMTDAMYRSSAQLSAYFAIKYLIPIDRRHFIAHSEVPDPNHPGQFGGYAHHTDPGRCWDWPKYMALIKDFAAASVGSAAQRLGDDSARTFARPAGWSRAASSAAYARSFSVTRPSATGTPAQFKLGVPEDRELRAVRVVAGGCEPEQLSPGGDRHVDGHAVDPGRRARRHRLALPRKLLARRRQIDRGEDLAAHDRRPGRSPPTRSRSSCCATRPASGLEAQAEGWVATARGLSSTADGGFSWESVSPPGIVPAQIRGIRIVGPKGWLVAATGIRKTPLALYSTVDRGRTWTSSTLPVPADVDVAAGADVVPVDTELLVGLRLQPNRFGLTRGVLLKSLDGIKWKQLPLPAGGRLAFPTTKDGWLVGGLANEQLFATHDAGKTWRAVRPPPAITGAASAVYALPTFSSATDGVLPVSLAAGTALDPRLHDDRGRRPLVDDGRDREARQVARLRLGRSRRGGGPGLLAGGRRHTARRRHRRRACAEDGRHAAGDCHRPPVHVGDDGLGASRGQRAQALLDHRRRRDVDAAHAAVERLTPACASSA